MFADDIVLIVKNKKDLKTLIEVTQFYFKEARLEISTKKSKVMTYDYAMGRYEMIDENDQSIMSFEQVLIFNYLGISLSVEPYRLFSAFNKNMKKKALNYMYNVLSLVKSGQKWPTPYGPVAVFHPFCMVAR